MWPFNLQRVAIESPMSCQCVAIESPMSCQCVAIQSPKRCQCVAIQSQISCQCDAVESPMNYQYSIQFNSLFQTHLRSIAHNYVSHHNRTMQHQHKNDRLCGLAYTSPLKTDTSYYCRRLSRYTRSGSRDRSDPDVAIKAYTLAIIVDIITVYSSLL